LNQLWIEVLQFVALMLCSVIASPCIVPATVQKMLMAIVTIKYRTFDFALFCNRALSACSFSITFFNASATNVRSSFSFSAFPFPGVSVYPVN